MIIDTLGILTILFYFLSRASSLSITMTTSRTASATSKRGLMMILSPAKTLNLNFETSLLEAGAATITEPSCDFHKTNELVRILKTKTKKQLKDYLKISDNLAKSVLEYYDNFEMDPSKRDSHEKIPSAYAFDGPAYKGLDVRSCSSQSLEYLQSNLRIVDPLYGCLRPLDIIQPYRLEMATKSIMSDLNQNNKEKECKSLSSWWSESITTSIANDLNQKENGKYLINLASDEYSAAIDCDLLPNEAKFVKVVFQQEGRVIAVHAKRARGLMARYIADNEITNVDDLQKFDIEGYGFVEGKSNDETIVFDRLKPEKSSSSQKRKVDASDANNNNASKKSATRSRKRK